jgi:hypothetical protein
MTITNKSEILQSIPVTGDQETLKHILIGDYSAILKTQDWLALYRYAEKTAWTQPQPIGLTGEYISVLIRRRAAILPAES